MIEKLFNIKSKDDKIIYLRIFYVGCNFTDITFPNDKAKKNEIIGVLNELIIKLAKVIDEIRLFQANKIKCEKELFIEVQKGISAVPTHELAKNLENFLTLAKGTLDIFAKQFLKAMFGFEGKWNCHGIIKYLQKQSGFDKRVIDDIISTLEKENDEWIKDFIDDRNLHHEKNIGLSSMRISNGHPHIILTRRNGQEVTDVIAYLRYHYNKICHLIEYLIRLSFCAVNPAWGIAYLKFVPPPEME